MSCALWKVGTSRTRAIKEKRDREMKKKIQKKNVNDANTDQKWLRAFKE